MAKCGQPTGSGFRWLAVYGKQVLDGGACAYERRGWRHVITGSISHLSSCCSSGDGDGSSNTAVLSASLHVPAPIAAGGQNGQGCGEVGRCSCARIQSISMSVQSEILVVELSVLVCAQIPMGGSPCQRIVHLLAPSYYAHVVNSVRVSHLA